MYYTIKENSEVIMAYYINDLMQDSQIQTLEWPKSFNESWFKGYDKCSCCNDVTAKFILYHHESGHTCYLFADKRDVVEYPDKASLPKNSH